MEWAFKQNTFTAPNYLTATIKHPIDTDNSPLLNAAHTPYYYIEKIRQLHWFNHVLHLTYIQQQADRDIPLFRWNLMDKHLMSIKNLSVTQLRMATRGMDLITVRLQPNQINLIQDFQCLGLDPLLVERQNWINTVDYPRLYHLFKLLTRVTDCAAGTLLTIRHLEETLWPRLQHNEEACLNRMEQRIKAQLPVNMSIFCFNQEQRQFDHDTFPGNNR